MGFSTPSDTGATPSIATAAAAPAKPNFGDRLGEYFNNRYPVVGGLASAVFPEQFGATNQQALAPLSPMPPYAQTPDYSQMIDKNAQPQQGSGGLAALLKLFA